MAAKCLMVWAGMLDVSADLHDFDRGSVTVVRYGEGIFDLHVRLIREHLGLISFKVGNAHSHRAQLVVIFLESGHIHLID
ncbi:hypothetical protein TNCV_3057421 [Trichonephila clavipes]|nr:hypothetical protein TNCV_3057421 [Trichonephila clavipes]